MRIIFIGDVVSTAGSEFLMKKLPPLRREKQADFVIVNGENSAPQNGINKSSAELIYAAGADVITTGNHVMRRPDAAALLENPNFSVLRPLNLPRSTPGRGVLTVTKGSQRLAVINIMGRAFMDGSDNPFDSIDKALAETDEKCILVDFHAEATGEKRAMGLYLDGRVSAVCGTHTHIPTADACVLPGGTAYITDTGMTGVIDSVLGVKKELVIAKLKDGAPSRFAPAEGRCRMDAVIIDIDNNTGRSVGIEQLTVF